MAYNAEQARIQAEQDSLLALNAPLPTADSAAIAAAGERLSGDSLQAQRRIMQFGELLAAAQQAEAEEFTVENEVLKIDFSTRGGQVKDVTLKDYTKYAPRDERNQPVRLFDPATANFALTFYVKNGHNNVLVNTADYTFNLVSMEKDADGAQRITMDLPVARDAVLRYEYVVYNIQSPARDYLVDLNVYLKIWRRRWPARRLSASTGATGPIRMRKGFRTRIPIRPSITGLPASLGRRPGDEATGRSRRRFRRRSTGWLSSSSSSRR